MKINLDALDELDNRYQQDLAEGIESPCVSDRVADSLEAAGIRFHDAIELVKAKAIQYGMDGVGRIAAEHS